jgi:hypothetical protein
MNKADSEILLSKLKSSVSRPPTVKSRAASVVSAPAPSGTQGVPPQLAKPAKPVKERQGTKVRLAQAFSVSLYRSDLARLDKIKDFMRGKGHRNLSDSEAIRLACRAAQITDEFLEHYDEMQKEDLRRRTSPSS